MNKQLIINAEPAEVTIALVEDKQLIELHKERANSGFMVGDIYLGKVKKIMPGLNAAFVSIGHEKEAFIHYLDLGLHFSTLHKMVRKLAEGKSTGKFENTKLESQLEKRGKISDFISPGQQILVQIAKEAISTKGPRLTSDVSLAGRHVVLLPLSNKVSISQKIRSKEERKRLARIAKETLPRNYGVIVRTAAQGKSDRDIEVDIKSLVNRWETALGNLQTQSCPSLLLGEINRATSLIRDLLNGDFSSIVVDDKDICGEIRSYIAAIAPEKEKIVKLYRGSAPVFDNFDISRQIRSLFARIVSLKRGAYLIIEHTEALHVIDVNSGNRTRADEDPESNAMEVNLAAAEEIARQLRLRDLGGIIVIDFIDLGKAANREELLSKMQELMKIDRAKHSILPLSKFGLMQITRQRVRPPRDMKVSEVCPTCNGTGSISHSIQLHRQIENQIAYFARERGMRYIKLVVSPFVAAFLRKGAVSLRLRWMFRYGCRIRVAASELSGYVETKFLDRSGRELE